MDDDQNSPWQYKPDGDQAAAGASDTASAGSPQRHVPVSSVSWEAAEFIEHPHPAGWYAALVCGTAVLAALVYLITKDFIATGTILAVGIIVGVFAGQKPVQAKYEISDSGISINGKTYPHTTFKSFAVLREGSLSSVNLFPLKRFMPVVSAYFKPDDEEKIANALGNYLPYEDRKMDGIDRLSRRLRL